MNDADSVSLRVCYTLHDVRLALYDYFSFFGNIDTCEALNEGRFSCSVFTE